MRRCEIVLFIYKKCSIICDCAQDPCPIVNFWYDVYDMHKTPPTPEVLEEAIGIIDNAMQSAESGYGLFPGACEVLSRCLDRLQPLAAQCLPDAVDALPIFGMDASHFTGEKKDMYPQEQLVYWLQTTRVLLERSLATVGYRRREKISYSPDEMHKADALLHLPSRYSNISSLWDTDLKRMEAAQYEHQWLPENWNVALQGEGASVRRLVAWKEGDQDRVIAACLLVEVQQVRKQQLLLNILEHPAAPGIADELLGYFLQDYAEFPTTIMAVREQRSFIWRLLQRQNFIAKGTIRNHYHFDTDFEDAIVMESARR